MKKFLTALACTLFLIGCGGGNEEEIIVIVPEEEIEVEEYEEYEEIDPFYGMVRNPLTGVFGDESLANRRPQAMVVNNLPRAMPQSGLSQADIIYEVLAEGGITRLLAIFTDGDAERVGPIRSNRDYFTHMAMDNEAVLVHHGGSPTGYSSITNNSVINFDGMHLEGSVFWRDQERFRQPGMREHSSYTSFESIKESMENRGIDIYLEQRNNPFNFFDTPTVPRGANPMTAVTIPFSNFQNSRFVFDEDHFRRYQRGDAQIDDMTDEQLTVSNIIVQKVPKHVIAGDSEGRMSVNLVGEGGGYLVTYGHYIPITWRRISLNSPTLWFDQFGEKLTLNEGKTWIAVFQNNGEVRFENSSPEEISDEDED